MTFSKMVFRAFAVGALLLGVQTAFGQVPTTTLTGTITDSTGAVVVGAEVTVTNVDTGVKRSAMSNESGFYTVPLLPPGAYDVQVQLSGFRKVEQKGVTLHVNEPVTLDFSLEIGNLRESITVEAEAPLLQAEQASQGAVIDNAKILSLPLNGRNPYTLAALVPGVQAGRVRSQRRRYHQHRHQERHEPTARLGV